MNSKSQKSYFFLDLFRKYDDGNFTDKTLLYRDILRYALLKSPSGFRAYDLTSWLLQNNSEFMIAMDKSKSNSQNIENRTTRVKNYLEELFNLELLLRRQSRASKGGMLTLEYILTDFGQFAAFMIEFNREYTDELEEQIYNFFKKLSQTEPVSSRDIFIQEFFRRCKERSLFKYYLGAFLRNLRSYPYINNPDDVYAQLILIPINNEVITKRIWVEWCNALNVFNGDQENLFFFLHHIKLELQKLIEKNVSDFSVYEKYRYSLANEPDFVTVEGKCNSCGALQYRGLNILKYLNGIILDPSLLPELRCNNCKEDIIRFYKPY